MIFEQSCKVGVWGWRNVAEANGREAEVRMWRDGGSTASRGGGRWSWGLVPMGRLVGWRQGPGSWNLAGSGNHP